jgi:hypothetical protein
VSAAAATAAPVTAQNFLLIRIKNLPGSSRVFLEMAEKMLIDRPQWPDD